MALRVLMLAFCFMWGTANAEQDSALTIGYEVYGRSPYPLRSNSVKLGYRQFEFRISKTDDEILLSEFHYREASLRYFIPMGSLFFVPIGVGAREVYLDRSSENAQSLDGLMGLATNANLFGPFGLGLDLFTVSQPIKWIKKSESLDEGSDPKLSPYIREAYRRNYQVLRVYLEVAL